MVKKGGKSLTYITKNFSSLGMYTLMNHFSHITILLFLARMLGIFMMNMIKLHKISSTFLLFLCYHAAISPKSIPWPTNITYTSIQSTHFSTSPNHTISAGHVTHPPLLGCLSLRSLWAHYCLYLLPHSPPWMFLLSWTRNLLGSKGANSYFSSP